jgi:hypothetical protein
VVSKNEEFYVDFKFVEMGSKMVLEKRESQIFLGTFFGPKSTNFELEENFAFFGAL